MNGPSSCDVSVAGVWCQNLTIRFHQMVLVHYELADREYTQPMADPRSSEPRGMTMGVGLGAALGAAFGAALGNVAIGMALGIALGAAIGLMWDRTKKD